jgi:hypothetical protein
LAAREPDYVNGRIASTEPGSIQTMISITQPRDDTEGRAYRFLRLGLELPFTQQQSSRHAPAPL